MDLDYTVKSEKTFDEAVEAVIDAAAEQDFGVQHIHDVQKTLSNKGIEREPVKIIDVCNPQRANAVLQQDMRVALMLPCPIVVYRQGGEVFISTMRASVMSSMFPDADIEEVAAEVEEALIRTVDASR